MPAPPGTFPSGESIEVSGAAPYLDTGRPGATVASWQANAWASGSRWRRSRQPVAGERQDRIVRLLAPNVASTSSRIASATRVVLEATHVGMFVATDEILTPLDCCDDVGALLDEQQFSLGDGPTLVAAGAVSPVLATELDHAHGQSRWPLFAPLAAGLDVRSAVALPLRTGVSCLGVLTAYRPQGDCPDAEQYADALVLATLATDLLVAEQAGVGEGALPPIVAAGLRNQSVVHQAAGMLSEQLGVSIVEALVRLRYHAVATDLPLAVVGRSIVAGELVLER